MYSNVVPSGLGPDIYSLNMVVGQYIQEHTMADVEEDTYSRQESTTQS